jgi:putative membrane protein
VFELHFIAIPWVPVALIGTAGAFMIGFKNTQSYNRLWEARQIWGGIVNNSRELSFMLRDFIETEPEELKKLYYRHFAWLTALRFQLREPKPWENSQKPHNVEYKKFYSVPEWEGRLDSILETYLSPDELNDVMNRKNKSAYILSLQSEHFKKLYVSGKTDTYKQIEIEKKLGELVVNQGKCERIKNFPYPRQYASINYYFVWLLVILMPFGLLNEFQKLGDCFTWLTIPFSTIASWVFTSMEKIGEASENPFEGGANDIPMASISRNIEIEMRDLLNEKELPEAILPVNNIVL